MKQISAFETRFTAPLGVTIIQGLPEGVRSPPWREFERIAGEKVGYQSTYFDGQRSHPREITCVCDNDMGGAHHHMDGVIREMPKYVRRY